MLKAFPETGDQLGRGGKAGADWECVPSTRASIWEKLGQMMEQLFSLSLTTPHLPSPHKGYLFFLDSCLGLSIHVDIFFSQLQRELCGCFRFLGLSEMGHVNNAVLLGF